MNLVDLNEYLVKFSSHEEKHLENLVTEYNLKDKRQIYINFSYIQKTSSNTYTPSDSIHLKLFDYKKNSRFLNVAEHRHDYIELNYVYSGKILQKVNNQVITLKKDDLIILDTQTKHSVSMPGKDDIMLAFRFSVKYFMDNFFRDFKSDNLLGEFILKSILEKQKYNRMLYFNITNDLVIKYLIRLITIEFIENNKDSENIEHHYILNIFNLLLRKYEQETTRISNDISQSQFQKNKKIIDYLEKNYKNISITKMALDLGYSKNYVGKLVKEATNKSFSEAVLEIRLKNTLILLKRTTLPISDIYRQCGFSNATFFYNKFSSRYGYTPKKYRMIHTH